MNLQINPSKLNGTIAVPGSKSHTIRGVLAALNANGTSVLEYPLESADTRAAFGAARAFGAEIIQEPERWIIKGTGDVFREPETTVDMLNSGTSLRLMCAAAARQGFQVSFDGDESLRTRPMAGLLRALEQLGVKCSSKEGKCPVSVRGPLRSGHAEVDGSGSQFLSALLLSLPLAQGEFDLELKSLNEQPYVRMTMAWLDFLGLKYECSDDLLRWHIEGGQRISAFTRKIPADFSTAAFPLAAGVLAGNEVKIQNLDFSDTQGDKAVFGYFKAFGADLTPGEPYCVRGGAPLYGGVFDLNATPDALPIMAAAALFAEGETRLVNVPQARIKETDRIEAMTQELRKFGADVEELSDGMVIRPAELHGSAALDSRGDHRIAMALAVAALALKEPSVIRGFECAEVSYPGFLKDFAALGAEFLMMN